MNNETGERLQYLREINGLTRTAFAEKIGISIAHLSLMERGQAPITHKTIKKVISAFNNDIAIGWLLIEERKFPKETPALETIGQRIRFARKLYMRLSQEQLGMELGVTDSFISAIERGNQTPSYAFIMKLITMYGLNPTWLLLNKGEVLL